MKKQIDIPNILSNLVTEDFQLNLPKIFKLEPNDQAIILQLYNDLMYACYGGGDSLPGGYNIHPQRINILYRTLVDQEYLVNSRAAQLDKLV